MQFIVSVTDSMQTLDNTWINRNSSYLNVEILCDFGTTNKKGHSTY